MPGRGNAGGKGRGPGHDQREGADPRSAERSDGQGRSEWSPGHLKKDAGEGSARDFAPGHGGEPPGQRGRDREPGQGDEGVDTLT